MPRRRFVEFQGKGLNASEAASISLKVGVQCPMHKAPPTQRPTYQTSLKEPKVSLRALICCCQMEAGQLKAPVDIAQLASVLTTSGSSSSDAQQAHLSTGAASAISDLFSSAPTLVLSLARIPAVQPAQPQTDQLVELDWEAVAQLGQALDGSANRYVCLALSRVLHILLWM